MLRLRVMPRLARTVNSLLRHNNYGGAYERLARGISSEGGKEAAHGVLEHQLQPQLHAWRGEGEGQRVYQLVCKDVQEHLPRYTETRKVLRLILDLAVFHVLSNIVADDDSEAICREALLCFQRAVEGYASAILQQPVQCIDVARTLIHRQDRRGLSAYFWLLQGVREWLDLRIAPGPAALQDHVAALLCHCELSIDEVRQVLAIPSSQVRELARLAAEELKQKVTNAEVRCNRFQQAAILLGRLAQTPEETAKACILLRAAFEPLVRRRSTHYPFGEAACDIVFSDARLKVPERFQITYLSAMQREVRRENARLRRLDGDHAGMLEQLRIHFSSRQGNGNPGPLTIRDSLQKALAKLLEVDRRMVLLLAQGYSYAEIADLVAYRPDALQQRREAWARQRCSRALRAVYQDLRVNLGWSSVR